MVEVADTPTSFQHIRLTVGPIAELRLFRPDTRNAMTKEMGDEVRRAVGVINSDASCRVLLVTGEGKSFCAGGDLAFLKERMASTHDENVREMLAFYRRFLSIRDVAVPTIAVVHGSAMGAGLCFALACDLCFAAASAQVAANFVRLGLHPGMGATHLLAKWCGDAHARDLLLTGRTLSGSEAHRLGMATEVFPEEDLVRRARERAEQLASAAPLAVRACKASLRATDDLQLSQALEREANAQADSYASADLSEGVAAVRDRRAPLFTGR